MCKRIRQTGLAQLGQAVPQGLDEIGRRLLQRPEAEIVLYDVGRHPNP